MASEIEKAADFIRRLGPARAEAARLLAEAAEGAGVWMHNLTNGAKALVRHEDTLARLITEGWSHIAPSFLEADNPTPPAPEAAGVASPPETTDDPAAVSEATSAPSQEPTAAPESDTATDTPPAKGKKA